MTAEQLRAIRGGRPAPLRPVPTEPPDPHSVLGIICPSDHANPPHEATCRVCGIIIPPQVPVRMPRPTLGILSFTTGRRVPLERSTLIGRSPKAAGQLVNGQAPTVVQVDSPGKDISRTHLEVRIEGWQLFVIDRRSANGTLVTLPGRAPQQIRSDEPFLITIGTEVRLADEVGFTVEAPT